MTGTLNRLFGANSTTGIRDAHHVTVQHLRTTDAVSAGEGQEALGFVVGIWSHRLEVRFGFQHVALPEIGPGVGAVAPRP
jgi:hypothetical protein